MATLPSVLAWRILLIGVWRAVVHRVTRVGHNLVTKQQQPYSCRFFLVFVPHLLVWLHWVLVVALEIFSFSTWTLSCGMWDLLPWPRVEPGPLALGAQSLKHWTIRAVPTYCFFLMTRIFKVYSLSNFQIYNIVWLTIVTMLYVTSPRFVYLITESLYLLSTLTQFPSHNPHLWRIAWLHLWHTNT